MKVCLGDVTVEHIFPVFSDVSRGRRFDSRPFHYQVTTLGKLFTHMYLCHQAVWFGTGLTAGKVTAVYGIDVATTAFWAAPNVMTWMYTDAIT